MGEKPRHLCCEKFSLLYKLYSIINNKKPKIPHRF
nr:MAG TPA: hypothetical protein [Caudoviricetes sp.]